jgi:hypothetical protein
MREFSDGKLGAGDSEFRKWLEDNPDHFFINLRGPRKGMLHRGHCPHMIFGPDDTTNLVRNPKWASPNRRELEERAKREFMAFTMCQDCRL